MAKAPTDKRLKRAHQYANDGTLHGLNLALETVAPATQEMFWDRYTSEMSRAPATVEMDVKRLIATLGSNTIDLHGLHRLPAQSVVSRVFNTHIPSTEPIAFITGKGKHSKCKQSILYSAVRKLLCAAGIPMSKSPDGRIVVVFDAECAALWQAFWKETCASQAELPSCQRIEIASNPSNVDAVHWNSAKQDGIDRRTKLKRTRARQRVANEKGDWVL